MPADQCTEMYCGERTNPLTEAVAKAAALWSRARDAMDASDTFRPDLDDIRRSRDGETYRRLIERHQRRVSAMMWRFARDAATHEELVQDVFVEAYTSLDGVRAQAPFAHWLGRIATRVGYRYWKRQARERTRPTVPLEEWDQLPQDDIANGMDPSQAANLLHRLLAQLPPRDRLVLTLRYLDEHDVDATARLTGWSRTMVKVQTWRARNKLRKLFEQAKREEDR